MKVKCVIYLSNYMIKDCKNGFSKYQMRFENISYTSWLKLQTEKKNDRMFFL